MSDLNDDLRLHGLSPNNIIAVYQQATDEQLLKGWDWYADAQRVAYKIADGDIRKGAGVLAALSPMKNWGENINLAARALSDGNATGHFRDACDKANRIIAGEDWPKVLPFNKKTYNFAKCIETGGTDPYAVCVDRHAFDVALGEHTDDWTRKVLDRKGAQEVVEECYREAARLLGRASSYWPTPAGVQAVTWVVWRDQKGIK